MPTLHFKQTTSATPEQFIAGLTDFGAGRADLFENSTDGYLKVHDQGPGEADVTEGSAGIWERLHYDWSDPNRVVLTTTDSNAWADGPSHTYTFTRNSDGVTGLTPEAFSDQIEDALENPVDFKSLLQEMLARRSEVVTYRIESEDGPPHARSFVAVADVRCEQIGRGSGRTKKQAEQEAASAALDQMDESD